MTGEQRHHIPPRLNKDVFNLMGFNDLCPHHPIPQAFPQIGYDHLVPNGQLRYVSEIGRAAPAPVACNDSVGVAAANGNAGAGEDTLQREANRLLGYTAKQTLDYAQSLYEKKLLIWTVFFGRSWKNAPPSGIG